MEQMLQISDAFMPRGHVVLGGPGADPSLLGPDLTSFLIPLVKLNSLVWSSVEKNKR